MATKYLRSNPGILGILVFISLTKVSIGDRCPLNETPQVFPTPPQFPDFMAAFEGTILRIGLAELLPSIDEAPTLSKACPESMNWTEFNSRLCGNDPFDLNGFCNPNTTTSEQPTTMMVASITTSLLTTDGSISIVVTTTTTKSYDNDNNATASTSSTVDLTSLYPGFNLPNDTYPTSPPLAGTLPPPPPSTHTYSDADLKDRSSSNDSEFEDHAATKGTDSMDPLVPSDAFAVNGSKEGSVAEALYQGDGASIAIGVGCGLTLLCFVIIVVIIVVSHQSRERGGCTRLMMNPLFKVFQRQTSDARPLAWSLSNQPSTPLEEIRTNCEILTNMNETQQRTEKDRIRID